MSPARLACSLAALICAAPALAQDAASEAPVRAVTLFEAGLAELTRETGEATSVTLPVPLRDVNDVLKSLLLRGDGITGARLTLAGSEPVADAFASLPFPPEAATDLMALLRSVPGLRVRVSDRAYPDGSEGTLMGVREECPVEGPCETILTVLHDDGAIRRHAFGEGLDLAILDPTITDALVRGLAALRGSASGTVREIAVAIEGAPARGALSYVVAAPVWKTAYRAVTGAEGAVDLQAWAVVENATGEDWDDVALTLSSGSPRTLTADLHGRDWRYRQEVAPTIDVPAPVVMEPEAPRSLLEQALGADADSAAEAGAAGYAPAPVASVGTDAAGNEGVLDSRFSFPEPVDLAAGEMLSLPFLAEALDATHLSLWEGALFTRTGNPDMVLEVVNDLDMRLPAGIMTVSDEDGGYVGDADMPLVAPGETEAVPFGADRRLRVEETVSETTRQVSVRASEGVLVVTQEQVREVSYAVGSPSGETRAVAIDHPQQEGWTTEVVAGPAGEARQDDEGRRWLRFSLDVPGGEAGDGAGAELTLRDRQPFEQEVSILGLDAQALLAWSGQVADEASRAYLDEAARLARAQAGASEALARAEGEQRALGAEQERVRRVLSSVPEPSEAHDRFLADLLALEDRIGAAVAASEAARAALAEAQDAFQAHLSGEG